MPKFFIMISLLLLVLAGRTQTAIHFSGKEMIKDSAFYVLPDQHYSIGQIVDDPELNFLQSDSIHPAFSKVWWIRLVISNSSGYDQPVNINFFPIFNDTLWYFDQDRRTWNTVQSGFQVAGSSWKPNRMPLVLRANTRDTFFIKVDVSVLRESIPIRLEMAVTDGNLVRKFDDFQLVLWLITIIAVLGFFVYNCFLYFSFKDRTWLIYLLIQIGGILYLTGAGNFFNLLIPFRYVTAKHFPVAGIYIYHVNFFLNHIGTMVVMFGFVELTRKYLGTRSILPRLDKLMKYLLWAYLVFGLTTSVLSFTGLVFLMHFSVFYYNIFTALITLTILITAFTAFFRRVRAARYYLIANLVSLGLVLALAVLVGFFKSLTPAPFFLGNMAIMAQALLFSFALVERIGLIREELACRQLEARELMHEVEEIQARNKEIEAENALFQCQADSEKIKAVEMQEKLAANQRELAAAALFMAQKNELMAEIRGQIRDLNRLLPDNTQALRSIESNLRNNQYLNDDWEKFKLHFEQVHPNFFETLKQKYPGLTRYETRLCAYLHINLSTKEIAALLNIDPGSVRRAKTRLNKKVVIAEL